MSEATTAGDGVIDDEPGPHEQAPRGADVLGLFATAAALLAPVAFTPTVFASVWTPKAALTLAVGGVGLPLLVRLARSRDFASMAYLAFVCIAAASTVVAAERPMLALFGLYNHGVGLLFYAALGGWWAMGRSLEERSRRRVVAAASIGLGINVVIALLQSVFDLESFQLPLRTGRPEGLLGNPVHLGAMCAAGAAAAMHHWAIRRSYLSLVALLVFALGLQLSASRLALAVLIASMLFVAVALRPRAWWILAMIILAGLASGEAVARVSDVPTGTSRTVAATSAGGYSSRIETWRTGAKAFEDHPILGAGPGQFRAATAQYRSSGGARAEGPDRLLVDAHNVLVELAVTVGPLGLVAMLLFVVLAATGAGGPARSFALAGLSLTMLQPVTVMTVPVCLLALGTAARTPPDKRHSLARKTTMALSGAIGLTMAGMLVAGDTARLEAELDFTLSAAERSERMLPPWSEPASMLAKLNLFHSIVRTPDDPIYSARAERWREEASRRDPADPVVWIDLGELRLSLGKIDAAKSAFDLALAANPVSTSAKLGLGEVAAARDDHATALRWYRSALENERNPNNRGFLERRIRREQAALGSTD